MIDKNTGLPEVPEGYFWRVKKWNYRYGDYTLDVQLRRTVWGVFSVHVESLLAKHNERSIRDAAYGVLGRCERNINARASRHERKQFLGDYPPKRLS